MSTQKTPQRQPTVLERLDRLEALASQIVNEMRGNHNAAANGIQGVVRVLNAVIKSSGEGFDKKVEDLVLAQLKEENQARVDRAKKNLQALIDAGSLKETAVVSEKSVVIGREFDAAGQLIDEGYAQVDINDFAPGVRKELLGKEIGFVYKAENGTSFEVTGVLEYVDSSSEAKDE